MKYIKKFGALVLAFAMTLSFAACSDTTWVFDYDGEKIPSGLYIAFTMEAYREAANRDDLNTEITDLMKQTIEGKDAAAWIKDKAKEYAAKYVVINRKFDELGLTLSEEQTASIDSTVSSYLDQVVSTDTGRTVEDIYLDNGVSRASYRMVAENSEKNRAIFEKYYGKDGLEEVPYEDLFAHFKENFASVNYFSIALTKPAEGEELTEEQKTSNEERQKMIDDYVKAINDKSMTFNEAKDDYSHYVWETEHNAEDEEIPEDSTTTQWFTRDATYPNEAFVKAVFDELKPDGTAQAINNDNVYYITVRYDVTQDENNFEDMRQYVLSDVKGDDYNAMADGWVAALSPVVNDAAVSRYAPKNIKFE